MTIQPIVFFNNYSFALIGDLNLKLIVTNNNTERFLKILFDENNEMKK